MVISMEEYLQEVHQDTFRRAEIAPLLGPRALEADDGPNDDPPAASDWRLKLGQQPLDASQVERRQVC